MEERQGCVMGNRTTTPYSMFCSFTIRVQPATGSILQLLTAKVPPSDAEFRHESQYLAPWCAVSTITVRAFERISSLVDGGGNETFPYQQEKGRRQKRKINIGRLCPERSTEPAYTHSQGAWDDQPTLTTLTKSGLDNL